MAKQLYVHGSFMNDNYGDFLLYYATVNKATSARHDIRVISADVSETYDRYIEVNRRSKYDAVFSCNAAVLAGGGYFSEPPRRKLYWNLRFLIKHGLPLLVLSLRNIPYAILGVGAGPMSYRFARKIARSIFNKAEIVSVRDEESKMFLEDIGVENTIRVIPDWVMGMEKGDLVRESDEIRKIAACFDGCEIIFVHLSTKNDEKNPGMKIVINDLLEYSKTKENTRFVIGCDQDRASQEERAKEIVARFSPDRALFLPYSGPWMLSSVLGHVDKVVTDKLHVGIVATRLGKYVISVPFHTKTIRFYNQLNIPDRCKMLSDVNGGDVYDLLVSDADNGVENVEAIIELAKTNYSLLEEFLEKV